MIELPDHPWFLGCQFHPELKSRPNRPHPLFAGFVGAALRRHNRQRAEQPAAPDGSRRIVTPWSFRDAPFLIAGPCVVEDGDVVPRIAEALAALSSRLGIPVCFKASFDKANRARLSGARGPGLERGLRDAGAGASVRPGCRCSPTFTRPHRPRAAAQVVDVLQIPAFLCRQTDLLVAAGRTGRPGQREEGAVDGAGGDGRRGREGARGRQWRRGRHRAGHLLRLRRPGRGHAELRAPARRDGVPVIFDATHSVQQPGQGAGGTSGGQREYIPPLLRPRPRRQARTGSSSRPIPIRRAR